MGSSLSGTMCWWLTVRGKGDRKRLVPAARELMTELQRSRQSLGLTDLSSPNEANRNIADQDGLIRERPKWPKSARSSSVRFRSKAANPAWNLQSACDFT